MRKKQRAGIFDLKKRNRKQYSNKLPPANTGGIKHSELQTPGPKLRNPYGWAGMSAIYLLTQTFES